MTHEAVRQRDFSKEHRDGMRLSSCNHEAARVIAKGNSNSPDVVFSFQFILFASGHNDIKTPETFGNENYVIALADGETPADYGLEYYRVRPVGPKRYIIDAREKFEQNDPESIFWSTILSTILEPGEEYLIRGSCISKLFEQESSLESLPNFLTPLHDHHNWDQELSDPDNLALQYLRQFADFKPNIDIYVDQKVIDRLLKLQILDGSIEKITLDNGVIGYRIIHGTGYENNQGVNLVLKPPSDDRRAPISNRSSHAAGVLKVEFGKVRVYIPKENIIALNTHESIDFEALSTLPAQEQLLQIARFIRFNALYKNEDDLREPLSLSSEIVSSITDIVSSIKPEDIDSMSVDLAAAIGSELLVALMSNPELIIHLINHMHPDLFPYLNRENMQKKQFQLQIITPFTRFPLNGRKPRSEPTLDLSPITQKLINRDAVETALTDVNLGRKYESEYDLTWGMSRPGDIVRLALSLCPVDLDRQVKSQRQWMYQPTSEDRNLFYGLVEVGLYSRHLNGGYIDYEKIRKRFWR